MAGPSLLLPARPRHAEKIPLPNGIAAAFCSKRPEGAATYQLGPPSSGPISAGVFTQTNAAVARALYRTIVGLVDEQCRSVIDAYAGAGELTELLGHRAEHVIAIESNKEAVVVARQRIQAAGLRRRVIVRRGHVEELLPDHLPADLVVLDPPRAGCTRRVLDALVEQTSARIAYISCHPAALARDARRLLDAGYRLDRVIPFDMFPQTHHVEVLALLRSGERRKAQSRPSQ
jgi:23S rRNA (uracil1939-C5)-methyltransferase